MFGLGLGQDTDNETEKQQMLDRITRLEKAVWALTSLEMTSQCPQSGHAGSRLNGAGHVIAGLEPFVTRYDPMGSGKIAQRGVGDPSK